MFNIFRQCYTFEEIEDCYQALTDRLINAYLVEGSSNPSGSFFTCQVIKFKKGKIRQLKYFVFYSCLNSNSSSIISPTKNGSEFIFLLAPFSIILGNYIEAISEKWFKEVFVGALIATPIIGLIL